MNNQPINLPYLSDETNLADHLWHKNLLVVDLGTWEEYTSGHIPGAVHLDINHLKEQASPPSGFVPPQAKLKQTLSSIGLAANKFVIAYDHDNNSKACRLLWTLEYVNHLNHALLNGGISAWKVAGHPLQTDKNQAVATEFNYLPNNHVIATQKEVLAKLFDQNTVILDSRSAEEYNGLKSASVRKGHIPGAKNLNWLDTIDPKSKKLLPPEELETLLTDRNLDQTKEVIVHCQTHQRSSHTFVMLRSLGYKNIKGYAGSWSEWGNDPNLPIE